MFFLLRTFAWLAGLGALAYVVVFVPLGERTLWEHMHRISQTSEAQSLREDVSTATHRISGAVEGELRNALREKAAEERVVDRAIDEVLPPDEPPAPASNTPDR